MCNPVPVPLEDLYVTACNRLLKRLSDRHGIIPCLSIDMGIAYWRKDTYSMVLYHMPRSVDKYSGTQEDAAELP